MEQKSSVMPNWLDLSRQLGIPPAPRYGCKEVDFDEYIKYATKRIAIIDAEIAQSSDYVSPKIKLLKRMTNIYKQRLKAKLSIRSREC